MTKFQIREYYKTKRTTLSTTEIESLSSNITNQLHSTFNFEKKFVHTFYSVKHLKEIDTYKINNNLLLSNCKVATSITQFNPLRLNHSLITSKTDFILDDFRIPIPSKTIPINLNDLDFVLVPLLAFDKYGNRVGYGKGLYDSFLKDCNPACIKVGLSLFDVHHNLIPSEKHDIQLDYCITPYNIYNF